MFPRFYLFFNVFILNAFLFVNVSIIFLNVTMEIPEEEDWIMFGNVSEKKLYNHEHYCVYKLIYLDV